MVALTLPNVRFLRPDPIFFAFLPYLGNSKGRKKVDFLQKVDFGGGPGGGSSGKSFENVKKVLPMSLTEHFRLSIPLLFCIFSTMPAPAEGALGHVLGLDRRFLPDFDPKKFPGGGCLGVDIKAFFWHFGHMVILDDFWAKSGNLHLF